MILIAYGTRPEYVKMKPVIDSLTCEKKLLFTGQHTSLLEGNDFDYKMKISDGENRLDNIISSSMNVDFFDGIRFVLVQGDTASAFGLALAAFHRKIPVIHLEAGLRTYDNDNPYPEEGYRRMISAIASYHLCPTEGNKDNLVREFGPDIKRRIYVTGNTVLDYIDKEGCCYGNDILITLHRRENHLKIRDWFAEIEKIASENHELNFTFVLHHNPNVKNNIDIFRRVNVVPPMGREDFLSRMKRCRFMISDSGGVQEECSFLNKKVIVCRKKTERPESIGTHSFLCYGPSDLGKMFDEINVWYEIDEPCPYGDGDSTVKVVSALKNILEENFDEK